MVFNLIFYCVTVQAKNRSEETVEYRVTVLVTSYEEQAVAWLKFAVVKTKLSKSFRKEHFAERPQERAHILFTNAFNDKAQDLFCRNESRQGAFTNWTEVITIARNESKLMYRNVYKTWNLVLHNKRRLFDFSCKLVGSSVYLAA